MTDTQTIASCLQDLIVHVPDGEAAHAFGRSSSLCEGILGFAAGAACRFLTAPISKSALDDFLRQLQKAADVSQAYFLDDGDSDTGREATNGDNELQPAGSAPRAGFAESSESKIEDDQTQVLETALRSGRMLAGRVRDFPPRERDQLAAQHVKSVAVVPVFVHDSYRGCLSIHDCRRERDWSASELGAFRAAARVLSAALERHQADRTLRHSEAKFREIFHAANDAIFLHDMDTGAIVEVNRKTTEMYGYSTDEILQMDVETLSAGRSPYARKDAQQWLRRAATEGPQVFEWLSRDKSGREFWVEVNLKRVVISEKAGLLAIVREITERKKDEQCRLSRFQRARRQQAAIVELSTSDPVVQGDPELAFRSINEVATEALEVERASMWMLRENGAELHCTDLFEKTPQAHTRGQLLPAEDYPRYFQALRSHRAIDAHDALTDPRTGEFLDAYLVPHGISSMLDAAVRLSGEVVGILCLEHVGQPRNWSDDEIAFAGQLADQAAQALIHGQQNQAEQELQNRLRQLSEANRRLELLVTGTTDRERRMVAIKHEVNDLLSELGREPKYMAPQQAADLTTPSPRSDHS